MTEPEQAAAKRASAAKTFIRASEARTVAWRIDQDDGPGLGDRAATAVMLKAYSSIRLREKRL